MTTMEVRDGEVGRTITIVPPRRLPDHVIVPIVGITFHPEYPANLTGLERIAFDTGSFPPAVLARELDNEHDPNAVVVAVPALATLGYSAELGHLPRAIAARIASEMDDGVRWAGQVIEVITSRMDRPGVRITIYRKDNAR